ncbi:hypothetical protein, partial [Candidatus Venteria ishoeyi]|uniref:hypothetical protein n=1 Tax=Candidatus Venteria ishoeyi TaxID=1899563 RepID=UPI00255CDCC8
IGICSLLFPIFAGGFYYLLDQANDRKDKEQLYKKEITQSLTNIEKQISNLESLYKKDLQDYKSYNNERFYSYKEKTNVTLQELKGSVLFLRKNHFFITNEYKNEIEKLKHE